MIRGSLIFPQMGVGLSRSTEMGNKDIAVSGRSSDFRVILMAASSRPLKASDVSAAVVSDYSGGSVPDFHRVPLLSARRHLKQYGGLFRFI